MLSAKHLMCFFVLAGASLGVPGAPAVTPPNDLWSKFETVQQDTHVLHQQFEVMQHVRGGFTDAVFRYQIAVDFAQGKWREQPLGREGDRIRMFDGHDVSVFESRGTEYVHPHQTIDKDRPLPEPYNYKPDWNKMKEVQQLPCGFTGKDHMCIIMEGPMKPWARPNGPGSIVKMTGGVIRLMADTETGIWLRIHVNASVEGETVANQWELNYNIKQMSYSAAPDAALFKVPEGSHEVEKLQLWNEERIKKELVGKQAPEIQATDIHGEPVSLAQLKGKTVLLDFWTTWCPPCQSDASSIEKLNQKYGEKSLAVIGVSVDEDRTTVESYLKKHPHTYRVVLSSENRLPPPYQVGVFPTYLIISPDGTLMTAEQGDKGFGKLRKDLEKAGMNTE